MKVLVIGSGGREHAICASFARSARRPQIYCAPGNAGIAAIAACVAIDPTNIEELAAFAASQQIDLTFVGGETALALGVVDAFQARGLNVIGPTRNAAQLEASKAFAKDFMARHGIPTAKYVAAHSPSFAVLELESSDLGDESTPVVVKADGLAAGKGVVIASDRRHAESAINEMAALVGADAAEKIVLEEYLTGKEISLLAFVDGEHFKLMPVTRDHKRLGDGDTGPNTGGMGTFTDDSLLDAAALDEIVDTIVRPTIHGCIKEEMAFRGVLFIGLMMTAAGPKVLEYNVRFGDPETQSILARLDTDLIDICGAILSGTLDSIDIRWLPGCSATIVLAAEGYPASPKKGDEIAGLDAAAAKPGISVFHAGTAVSPDGKGYITSGGRVLGVTAAATDLATALSDAYAAVDAISWPGMQYRRDIGK